MKNKNKTFGLRLDWYDRLQVFNIWHAEEHPIVRLSKDVIRIYVDGVLSQ